MIALNQTKTTTTETRRTMAKTVDEIMNTEVFFLRPEENAESALHYILALGITGAPVADRELKALGHASFRDLLLHGSATVEECMTQPPSVIGPKTPIDEAARRMADERVHRLIVVDERTCVVGIVSALDVVAALVGKPEAHPGTFPHFDKETGITWTDQTELTAAGADRAPDGPGILMLIDSLP